MPDDSEELQAFLGSVLQSQDSADEVWRTMGRRFGLYFLGMLESGVEAPHALVMIGSYQAAMLSVYKTPSD